MVFYNWHRRNIGHGKDAYRLHKDGTLIYGFIEPGLIKINNFFVGPKTLKTYGKFEMIVQYSVYLFNTRISALKALRRKEAVVIINTIKLTIFCVISPQYNSTMITFETFFMK